ncbi:hypothetical protein [Brevibacillus laterosporus]|nr:hypothetical protein [Brevibacillus laterosporus]MDN9011564.1 hypothetical protein [Brevibacillus laterosporus]MDO0942612.1 hypothetical protein [Brevibacillus laterosporus]
MEGIDPRYHLSEDVLMAEPDWSIQYTCITSDPGWSDDPGY